MSAEDVARAWAELPATEWNRGCAAHLLRRAGFGGAPDDVDAAAARGLADTLQWMFDVPPKAAPDPVDQALRALGNALPYDEIASLQGAWVHRMVHAPCPLVERLALFWHGHFATGQQKVGNAAWMREQVDGFRARAFGPFGDLLRGVARDKAMLRWLDGESSVAKAPNENFARELFELFGLGIGHYAEADVREAARAFTGSRIVGDEYHFEPSLHDSGIKHVLGRIGALTGDDVIARVLELPASAAFLARKLYEHFAGPAPADELLAPLAERLVQDGFGLAGALGMLFRSRGFYAPACRLTLIKSPAEYAVGAVLALGARYPASDVAIAMADMGQRLYYPPSVKGWDGGRAWVSSQALFARQRFARALVTATGEGTAVGKRTDLEGPVRGIATDAGIVERYLERLLPGQETPELRDRLVRYFGGTTGSLRARLAELVHLILSLPEYQLA